MASKKYIFQFTLADGTTHSIPIEIPVGEPGGYYIPTLRQVSDTEIEVSYTPSNPGMPSVKPVIIEVDLTGYATEKFVTDKIAEAELNGGNVDFEVDNKTLKLENGVLSVNTTNDMEQDNTLPITSAGVFATVGNIEALLKTI